MIAVANHNGNVYFYDLRQPDADTKIRLNGIAYSATFNPVYPNLVATCSRGQGGLSVYDIRKTYEYVTGMQPNPGLGETLGSRRISGQGVYSKNRIFPRLTLDIMVRRKASTEEILRFSGKLLFDNSVFGHL